MMSIKMIVSAKGLTEARLQVETLEAELGSEMGEVPTQRKPAIELLNRGLQFPSIKWR